MSTLTFKNLEYSDREALAPLLRSKNSYLSEYSFTNAYLFREPHNYEIAFSAPCTFLRGSTYDGFTYMMPVCPIEIIPLEKLLEMGKYIDFFFPIQKEWLEFFPEKHFEYSYSEGDSDYTYLTERLASMGGRKLAKKRNLMKQYRETYEVSDVVLTLENFTDAKLILDTWEREIQENPNHGTDYKEALEALEKMNDFKLEGMISYAGGKPAGFVLGEELNDDTFALHFAKCSREFKGIYQHIYNVFCQNMVNRYKYMNFEQDLGKDTLRQSKSTYYPDEMKIKYRAKLRK